MGVVPNVTAETSKPPQLWLIVGGADKGGIVVRSRKEISSPAASQRLATGSVVVQVEKRGERLCYRRIAGAGPEEGWVSVRLGNGKHLAVHADDNHKLDVSPLQASVCLPPTLEHCAPSALQLQEQISVGAKDADCTDDLPQAQAESVSQDAGALGSLDRLVLWPRGTPKDSLPTSRCFTRVCVFGPHHSCTGAMMRELPRFFDIKIINEHRADSPAMWKHRIFDKPPQLASNVFCVCLVKDPAFWIQSLARDPCDGTFYEICPVQTTARKPGNVQVTHVLPRHKRQLFSTVEFDGKVYKDAIEIWEATTKSYFNTDIFPLEQTAVVRSEDLLFSFESVIKSLALRGLPWRRTLPREIAPVQETAKDWTHPGCTRRARVELLRYYREPKNRLSGLESLQRDRILHMNSGITRPLGYDSDESVPSWLCVKDSLDSNNCASTCAWYVSTSPHECQW